MGKNVAGIMRFLLKYDGWTSYAGDRATSNAVDCLERLGFVEVIRYDGTTNQVRLLRKDEL